MANIQGHATAAVPEGLHKIAFSVLQGSSADWVNGPVELMGDGLHRQRGIVVLYSSVCLFVFWKSCRSNKWQALSWQKSFTQLYNIVTVVEEIQGNTVLEIDIGGFLQSTDYFDYIQNKIRCIQYVESKTIINVYVVKALEADRF